MYVFMYNGHSLCTHKMVNVGFLFRDVGPRSKVWTEKEMLEMSAWEFAEVCCH